MTPYAWTVLCELVELGPMVNYELISSAVLEELRHLGLSRRSSIRGVPVLIATQLGVSEYHVLN
jgi:hypothetical protein